MFKPYELVCVKEEGYSYIGQVISRPIGNSPDTIMVRRVPNDPSTMVEMPVSKLSKTTQDRKYVQYAEVAGSLQFPVDMLRYDYCCPVNFSLNEDDLGRVVITHDRTLSDKLIVARATRRKYDAWTVDRWQSFLWSIKPLKTLKFMKGQ